MDENQQKVDFIKEQVKMRPIGRRKLTRRLLVTAGMAVLFAAIACLTFLVLEPLLSNLLYPQEEPEKVTLEIPAEEEINPEDMLLEEPLPEPEIQVQETTVVEKKELELRDMQSLYRKVNELSKEITEKTLVTITVTTSDTDWFNNTYENNGQSAGVIVARNAKELLILSTEPQLTEAEELTITFSDQTQAPAVVKGIDQNTGIAVCSVLLTSMTRNTRNLIQLATLGASGSGTLGAPVLAVGQPLGNVRSVLFGMVTSTDSYVSYPDANIHILTTDMSAAENCNGALITLSGQMIGILRRNGTTLTAYGISDLRALIERLSNGLPMTALGITGSDVPVSIQKELGVPQGAYVSSVEIGSAAMDAGIQSGDVIVGLNGFRIGSFTDYQNQLWMLPEDTDLNLQVMRQTTEDYQEMQMQIHLQ